MSTTPAQIKRYIGGKDAELGLIEHGGTLWATNRYWAVPASCIAPFLDQHGIGLTTESAGMYTLNGGLARFADLGARVSKAVGRILDPSRYTVPLKHATIGGLDACTFHGGHRYELFTRGRQHAAPIRADWLEWITSFQVEIDGLDPVVRYATTRKWPGPAAIFGDGDALLGVVMPLMHGPAPAGHPAPPPPALQAVQ